MGAGRSKKEAKHSAAKSLIEKMTGTSNNVDQSTTLLPITSAPSVVAVVPRAATPTASTSA